MPHVVRVIGLANGGESPHDGRYVQGYDPNTEYGDLALMSVDLPSEARKFETMDEFLAFRQQISQLEPERPDGLPNRPISGLHLEVITVRG